MINRTKLVQAIVQCAEESTWHAAELGRKEMKREIKKGYGWSGLCPICRKRLKKLAKT